MYSVFVFCVSLPLSLSLSLLCCIVFIVCMYMMLSYMEEIKNLSISNSIHEELISLKFSSDFVRCSDVSLAKCALYLYDQFYSIRPVVPK